MLTALLSTSVIPIVVVVIILALFVILCIASIKIVPQATAQVIE